MLKQVNNFPLISVIVPNYNHEKYLEQRLDSIFNQTYQNFEVILLDDCSTDESVDILNKYALNQKVTHCVFNDKNSGNTFKQWQKGIELAAGEFIWIAESDDYCETDFLEKVSIPLINDELVTLCYCQSNKVDSNNIKKGNWIEHTNSLNEEKFKEDFILEGNIFIEKYLISINVIPNASAVLLRKNKLTITDDLVTNNDLKTCGDWTIYFDQIIDCKIAFIADSLNNFRYHNDSVISRTVQLNNRSVIVDINLKMRKLLFSILKIKKPFNFKLINLKNEAIIKSLKYEKSLFLIKNNQKIKGLFMLLSVFDEFLNRYKLSKKIKIKLKKLIS